MRSAFRRELSRTGLQIVGLLLGLLVMLILGFVYGHHIEGEVRRVTIRQHRDHRHIVAIERGHPLNSKRSPSSSRFGSSGGDAFQPGPTGHQPPGPSGGHQGHHGGSGHSGHYVPLTPPAPSPAPAPPASEPSPGNSGSTPGAEHGVKACVEVAVSACVKAEVELPLHP